MHKVLDDPLARRDTVLCWEIFDQARPAKKCLWEVSEAGGQVKGNVSSCVFRKSPCCSALCALEALCSRALRVSTA